MSYSPDIFKSAMEKLNKRRMNALSTFEHNKEIAYQKIPELKEIDAKLSQVGLTVARAVLDKSANLDDLINQLKENNMNLLSQKIALLTQNGFAPDFLEIHYSCKKCNDEGFIRNVRCSCLNKLLQEESFSKINNTSPMQLTDFSTFDLNYYPETLNNIPCRQIMQGIFQFCMDYAAEFSNHSPNLLLSGGTGLGKTHLTLAIVKQVITKGYGVIYGSTPNLLSAIEKERFNSGYEETTDSLTPLLTCDLLVLDDLGAEFTTQFTVSTLYNIINTRLCSEKPTIINANLTLSELEKRYADRITSRLLGCYEHLRFVGNDIRILQKKRQG